jgi:division/cell wall cluster transcriptional repressor MraZ
MYTVQVDKEGRLKLPEEFRRTLEKSGDPSLFITSRDGCSALIYPKEEWERAEGELADLARSNPAVERLLAISSLYGEQVKMDPHGRLKLPELLRESAKIANEIVLIGNVKYLEAIDRDVYKKSMHLLSSEDTAELDNKLNRGESLD